MRYRQERHEAALSKTPTPADMPATMFRALIESFSDYIWQVDENAIYTYVSAGVRTTLGYDPGELLGKAPFSIMPPGEVQRVAAIFGPIAAEHRAFSLLENTVLHKDGHEMVLETSGRPLFDKDGVFRGYVGIDRDVTKRWRAERALAESELMFHTLFDAEADGILVADAKARQLILANSAMCRMLGYSNTQLLELSIDSLFPASVRPLAADYFERLEPDSAQSTVEISMTRKDGSEFTATIVGSPMTLGGRLYSIGLFRDTTEHHRQEEQLREEKDKFRGLVEQNVAGIVIVREDGTIAYGNPFFAVLSGREIDDVIGHSIFEFAPTAEGVVLREKLAELFSGPAKLLQLTTFAQTIDGRIVDLLLNASRVTFEGKSAAIAIVLDISEQKRAERALRASERNLSIALQMARAGYWEYDVAADRFTFNDNFYRIFHTSAEAVGGYVMSSAEYAQRFVHPDDMGIVAAEVRAAIETKDPQYCRDIDHRIIYADGEVGYIAVRFFVEKDERGRTVRTYGVNQDITQRKLSQETLKRLNRALRTLSTGNTTIIHAEHEPEFLQAMCGILVEVGGYAAAAIEYIEHDEAKTVRPVAWAGNHPDYVKRADISWADVERGRGPTGVAIRTGSPAINPDFVSNPNMEPWRRQALAQGFASSIALPLKESGQVFGALTIYAQERGVFDPDEVGLLEEFSADLAFGITALRTRAAREEGVARLRSAMTSTVLALAATLERRDPYTAGHQRNVAKLASAIAAKVGISEQERNGIYLAAVIHDIGKIQVPGEILSKPGKLTDLEFQIIKTHAQAGYDIVKGIDFPWPVADLILQHHERLDGSGYPRGLKGDAILRGATILAVADVVEAMTAHRPYRPGLGIDAALAEITQGRGVRYDAAAVDACIDLIRNENFTFEGAKAPTN
jgi:PAS domain S-box-containing protein/putative nucleotidyltransferase with HDIG domain